MKANIIRGKHQNDIFNRLEQLSQQQGSATVNFGSISILYRDIRGNIPAQSERSGYNTALATMEKHAILKRIKDPFGWITGAELLVKRSGPYSLRPIGDTSTITTSLPNTSSLNREEKRVNTKHEHAFANARRFREMYLEEKEKNPSGSHRIWFQAAFDKLHEKVESGNFRFIVGRTIPYAASTCYGWLTGKVQGGTRYDEILPNLLPERVINRKPASAASELAIPPILIQKLESLDSLGDKINNLSSKDDIKRLREELGGIRTSFSQLVIALWRAGNGPTKSSLSGFFPDLTKQAQQQDTSSTVQQS